MLTKDLFAVAFFALLTIGCSQKTDIESTTLDDNSYVTIARSQGSFPLFQDGTVPPILVSNDDHAGVIKAANDLAKDIERVTGRAPGLVNEIPTDGSVVIVGSIDSSPLIAELVKSGKLDTAELSGKWEKFIIQTIEKPWEGVAQALIICGSDKRGTIYGAYDLSESIGVSPWYWWADVPIEHQQSLYVKSGAYTDGEPKVKYRGIFINDEAPALSGWAYEKFGGFNSEFYKNVFELILRLKGNYLWPAMWGRSIYDDDPLSPKIADEWGVVLGTSHHEPLSRAHVEWRRYGEGPWNYRKNKDRLQEFWREGVERMGDNESIVTVGMRGDGDEAMSESTEVVLLEQIVADQREIIKEITGKKVTEVPQMWALYKEVQDYYDKGMRTPDDVTLLLCDDNWGNIRKLPAYGDTSRAGGYGIYYHFDYVGGPRNYKWINTTQIERVWEQMNTAYEFGVDQVWVVNVGDIKPMEFPISFFLDFAWDPTAIGADDIGAYTVNWTKKQFGTRYAQDIADILALYTKYNSRRKPEMLSEKTYSLDHFREFERVVSDYKDLAQKAEEIGNALPEAYQSAYFQLVLYPVKASANLNELYFTVAKNQRYAGQGRATTNNLAKQAKTLYDQDTALVIAYHALNDGKWNHFMDQTHIGYTYWQQPDVQTMPDVVDTLAVPEAAAFGLAVEGTSAWWPQSNEPAMLPSFDSENDQAYYLELFNRGSTPYQFEIIDQDGWLNLSTVSGEVKDQVRINVTVNWEKVDQGFSSGKMRVSGAGETVLVAYNLSKLEGSIEGAIENDGLVVLQANAYDEMVESDLVQWVEIPNLGRTGSAMLPLPSISPTVIPGENSPRLEYKVHLHSSGVVRAKVYTSPTLNYHNDEGLSYAISFDDQPLQLVNIHEQGNSKNWNQLVGENVDYTYTTHELDSGAHVLKYWYVDPRIPLQKIEVIRGEEKKSYLGGL